MLVMRKRRERRVRGLEGQRVSSRSDPGQNLGPHSQRSAHFSAAKELRLRKIVEGNCMESTILQSQQLISSALCKSLVENGHA